MSKQISVENYLDYVVKNYKQEKFPSIGNIFIFNYNNIFNRNSKFSDFYPIVFINEIDLQHKTFTGLNFNYIPINAIHHWIEFFKRLDTNKPIPQNFTKIKSLLHISSFAFRKYNMMKIRTFFKIEKDMWDDMTSVYSNTLREATLKEIEAKYLKLI